MKQACILLSLDYNKYRKKWKQMTIMSLIGGIILIYLLGIVYGLSMVILIEFYIYIDKQNVIHKANQYKLKKQQEFINFISYIIVFLENKYNVYQSLKVCIPYLDDCLKKDIEHFVEQIDSNKSIIPYVDLANNIGTSLVMQMMIMLYQINKNGYEAKYLTKFPYLIDRAHALIIKEKIQKKRDELVIYSIIPILSLMIIVFVFVFSILSMVGGNSV